MDAWFLRYALGPTYIGLQTDRHAYRNTRLSYRGRNNRCRPVAYTNLVQFLHTNPRGSVGMKLQWNGVLMFLKYRNMKTNTCISGFILVPCGRLSWFLRAFDRMLISHCYLPLFTRNYSSKKITEIRSNLIRPSTANSYHCQCQHSLCLLTLWADLIF